LTTTGHQRAGTKVIEDFRSRQNLEHSIKVLLKAISEAELRAKAVGEAEAHTQQDPYTICIMATKLIIAPKTTPSTLTPNRK
jgi:hypothetical protein